MARASISLFFVLGASVGQTGVAKAEQPASAAVPQANAATTSVGAAQLFDEGITFVDAERWAEARQAFLKAWQLSKTYDIAANLGHTEMKLGDPRAAAEHLSLAIQSWPVASNKKKLRQAAEQELAEARSQVGALQIRVSVAGAELWIDGAQVEASPQPHEFFVLPGRHTVRAALAGYEPMLANVDVGKGESKTVPMALRQKDEGTSTTRTALLVGGAATTAVLLGAGAWLTAEAGAKKAEAKALAAEKGIGPIACEDRAAPGCGELFMTLKRHDTLQNIGYGAFVTAGVTGLATGVYALWPLLKPKAKTEVRALPVVTSSAAGLWMSGKF